jgi:putative intracellular protease/amidase
MADWEIGYLTAELNSGRFYKKGLSPSKIVTVGIDKTTITTMGGLKLQPDLMVKECIIKRTDALILPGGDTWLNEVHEPIFELAKQCIREDIVLAAICGATLGLAKKGLLDLRWHTSNDLEFLKMLCPEYKGEKHYKFESAVTDGKLITAPGAAPLEFAFHVFKALEVFSPKVLELWYNHYKTHKAEYYYELMNALQ